MRRLLIIVLLLSLWQPSLAQLSPEQELFLKAGKMTRDQQRDPSMQRGLRKVFLQAIELYCHHLDKLACQSLFSVGNPERFRTALVNVDGVQIDRNVIYVEGKGAPQHLDNGPFILPLDFWQAYLPLNPNSSTLWHEAQHELLAQAGMAGALYSQDSHHDLIEGIGERGAEAFGLLLPFENEIRKAAAETQGKTLTLEQERAYWGSAQALWRKFALGAQHIRRVGSAGTSVEHYRDITGIYYGSANEVQGFYQSGGLKLSDGSAVLPPAWVFDTPGYLPADIDVIASPPVIKGTSYECSVGVTIKANTKLVKQGKLRIKLETEDNQCGLRVSQDNVGTVPGLAGPGGPSTRLFDIDISKGQPITVTFSHLRTDKLQAVEYPITLSYTDPGADRQFSDTQREYVFKPAAQSALKLDIQGARTVEPGKPLKLRAVLTGDQTGLQEIYWYDETRNKVLGSGESIDFQADDPNIYTVYVKARVRREGTIATGAEVRVPIDVRRSTPAPTIPTSSPDKPVVHLSSTSIMASDFFTMRVDMPAWMAAKAKEYYWSVGALTQVPQADLQLDATDVNKGLGVSIRDARGDELGEVYAPLDSYKTSAAQFSFQAPASWQITKTARGNYSLSRDPSLDFRDKASQDGATASASGSAGGGSLQVVWLSDDDMRDINGGQAGPREWKSLGDPRSRIIRTKGGMGYEITIHRSSYFLHDGDSKLRDALRAKWEPQVKAHTERFDKEIEAFLASLTVTPDGVVTRVPDQTVTEANALTVRIEGARSSYRPAEESTIRAVVQNAGPKDTPLQYEWSGSVVGKGAEVKLVAPSHSDKGTVGVTVRGASGASAVAQIEFAVSNAQVSLSMDPPGPSFPVGSLLTLTAKTSVPGKLTYAFEPADQLEFLSNNSGSATAQVRLRKPGSFQVWVKVMDASGAILAESQPLSLEVVQQLESSSDAAKAGGLMEDARKALEAGQFEQAASLANKAASADPGGTTAARSELATRMSDIGWKAVLADDYAVAKAALAAAESMAPQDPKIVKRHKDVLKAESVWPRVQELGAQCHKLIDEKKMISAYPIFSEVVRLGNDLCYERMDQHPFVQAVGKHWYQRQEEFNQFYREAEARIPELTRDPNGYGEILNLADGMESWELDPVTRRQVEGWRAEALAMRDKALALWVDVTPLQHETPVSGQFLVEATVRGGVPPYRYEWKLAGQNTGATTAKNVWKIDQAGTFSLQVLVSDSQGRTASAESRITVTAPVRAPLRAWVNPAQYQATAGVAFQTVAQAEGGTPPYRFEWLVGNERSGVINQVNTWTLNQPGVYPIRVLVTDAQGQQTYGDCTATLGTPAAVAQPTTPSSPATPSSPSTPPNPGGPRVTTGASSAGTSYPSNCQGDPFTGGHWCNARNGSDWIQRDFGGLYRVNEIRIGAAGTDVTTDNSSIVIKVLDAQGQWQVIDKLVNTNINISQLSGGARGNSIPSYRRSFSPPLQARAVRIELSGHGWFNVSDVAVIGDRLGNPPATTPVTQPSKPPVTQPSKPPVTQPSNTQSGGQTVLAVLENASSDNIHLFGPGETFDPANRLAPGQTRKVSLRLPADGRIEFTAGRSGQVLQRKIWSGDPSDLSRFPRVRWTDDGLIITTGLR